MLGLDSSRDSVPTSGRGDPFPSAVPGTVRLVGL